MSELIIVIALLGVLLTVIYWSFYAAYRGTQASDRQAYIAREIGDPLQFMETALCQIVAIENQYPAIPPSPYGVSVRTDRDGDQTLERNVIEARSDHTLRLRVAKLNLDTTEGVTLVDMVLSENNYNVEAGIPLLTFYDRVGNEIAPEDVAETAQSDAFAVRFTVVTEFDGEQYSDSRTVYFRNR